MRKLMVLGALVLAMAACSSKDKMAPTEPGATAGDSASNSSTVTEPGAAKSATATVSAGMTSKCMLDKDQRVIEVRKTDSGGCELFYTKFGEEKSVASSGFGTQYCEEVKDRIESNLSKAGFSCQ